MHHPHSPTSRLVIYTSLVTSASIIPILNPKPIHLDSGPAFLHSINPLQRAPPDPVHLRYFILKWGLASPLVANLVFRPDESSAGSRSSAKSVTEPRRVSFVGEVGDGTPQPSNEFHIDDIPELSPSPPSLPVRPSTHQLAQKLAVAEQKIALYAELAGRLQAACDTGEIGVDYPERQGHDRCITGRLSSLH